MPNEGFPRKQAWVNEALEDKFSKVKFTPYF